MLSDRLFFRFLMKLFRVLGICSVRKTKMKDSYPIIFVLLAIVYIISILILVAIYKEEMFFQGTFISLATDTVQGLFPLIAHLIIVIDSQMKMKIHEEIINDMETIDLSLSKIESFKLREANNLIEMYFFRNIFFNVLLNFIEWKIIISTFENKPWFYQWISKHGSLMVLRFSDSQFLLQLVYLQSRFESLSKVMLLDQRQQMENDTHLRLIFAKKCYNMLLGVLKKVNHRFERSIFLTNLNNFLCITIDLYWNFSTLYFGGNRYWQGK